MTLPASRPPSEARGDVWVIGDVQGCAGALRALLAHPELSRPDTELWFAGDLVNRGPDSLGALRLIRSLGARARAILGNHDLHLLAVAAGVRTPGKSDTFQDILDASDAAELLDWLRHRPLMVRDRGHVMVHAGILPAWTLDQAQALAGEIEAALRQPDWHPALHDLYGEKPLNWDDALRAPTACGSSSTPSPACGSAMPRTAAWISTTRAAPTRSGGWCPGSICPGAATRPSRWSSAIGRPWGCTSARMRSAWTRAASGGAR